MILKKFIKFTNENIVSEKNFIVDKNNLKFKLFLYNILVAESYFTIETPDEFFDEKYLTLYDVETVKEYRGRGFAKYLLEQIFYYAKNKLNLNIITLIVYKDNYSAVNLYFKTGFEIYIEYEDSYSLIKKLS